MSISSLTSSYSLSECVTQTRRGALEACSLFSHCLHDSVCIALCECQDRHALGKGSEEEAQANITIIEIILGASYVPRATSVTETLLDGRERGIN